MTLELKSTGSLADHYEDLLTAFEAFKETNDERLASVEKKLSADVITTDKLDRINKAIDELSLKQARPERGGTRAAQQDEAKAHSSATAAWTGAY